MQNFAKRKGMTLIEVLIVVSVIITLSTSMFLSSTQVTGTADAAKIIADLTTIRKAAIAWTADNRDRLKANYAKSTPKRVQSSRDILNGIAKYIDNNENITLNGNSNGELSQGGYGVCGAENHQTTWYAGYKFANDESHLKEKLRDREKSAGLHFTNKWPDPTGSTENNKGDNIVWMYILGDMSTTKW